ncbi:alpha/beta hydrolase [Paraburkholderia sp. USG1]|uniref:alpha/beta fold hydrolase n=1 Tax=Paraburkholderia sp. USG1 TaxID=2952268 RepID=UPI0028623E8B|nr:alpha/beta hydrolase [Paraburkholderia sp. USG1]MDR8398391.1 alpha/beta hydrolase [Paraburkholderia sp. USG1]
MHIPATTTAVKDSGFAELPATSLHGPLRIEYRWLNPELGEAPIVMFLHEGLGSIAMWKDWPQMLCDRLGLRGFVYSRPGYGHSTPRPHDAKWPVDFMSVQAHDVLPALLDTLGVDAQERSRMWLVGHSDGGSIALLYASAFPDALAGTVLIAPHVFVEGISVESIAQTKIAYETTDLRTKLARYHGDVDSAFYGWNDVWLNPAFRAWNIVNELKTIRCPVLAIQAHDDQYGTMAQIETIARHVSGARLLRLDRGGHSPHRDAPETLTNAIATFTAGIKE